jgi:hypothetical protein
MYYKDPTNNSVYFYDSPEFVKSGLVQISDIEAAELTKTVDVTTAEENKSTAVKLLRDTDWVEFPSVNSPTSTPQLLNVAAFSNYRTQLRLLAINPTAGDLNWPVKPSAEWKL